MAAFFEFSSVDTFTTGTVGRPGQRTFLIQTRVGQQRITLKCEKQQVQAIAQYFRQSMVDLPAPDERPIPAQLELVGESDPLFTVGPIALGYARELDRFVLTLEELVPFDGDEDEDEDDEISSHPLDEVDKGHVRAYLTRAQAVAFVDRVDDLIAASRPNCQFCGNPLDPDGHLCPRMN